MIRLGAQGAGGDLVGLAGLGWSDAVGAHHFVVFVFDDVAVPDELAALLNWVLTRVTWAG